MTPLIARDLLERLQEHPVLYESITWLQIQRFLSLTRKIYPEIEGNTRRPESPTGSDISSPTVLPHHVCNFLASVLELDSHHTQLCWVAFRDFILNSGADNAEDDTLFRVHGHSYQIGAEQIRPPQAHCVRESCQQHLLGESRKVESKLFTLRRGVLPIWSVSLYCRGCLTRYYHNYSVQNAENLSSKRQYYENIPNVLHVFEHSFVERALCEFIETEMAVAQTSAESIAKVYNLALGSSHTTVSQSRLNQDMTGALVFDAFLLHALIRDKYTHGQQLSLPHRIEQQNRFDKALNDRNYRVAGTGQEMWPHACNKCMKLHKLPDGSFYRVTAGVTDGVTIGHPCCSVHDCKIPLSSQKHRFCSVHSDLRSQCCITSCVEKTEQGYMTCLDPAHRQLEMSKRAQGAAIFKLRDRLRRADVTDIPPLHVHHEAPPGAVPSHQEHQIDQLPEFREHAATTGVSVAKVKGRFSRRWTHNEQLFVRCCGVIISRATFYGSEGISGVKNFLIATFPPSYPGALPSYIFYDNNCRLKEHLLAIGDAYFDNVGLPVDVFHAECKHKETDIFCQTHCNPARFGELVGEDGKWIFNSSAAEQANKWFGKFQSIAREMTVARYNFFLDEVIAFRNRLTVAQLQRDGHQPHFVPEEVLREAHVLVGQS